MKSYKQRIIVIIPKLLIVSLALAGTSLLLTTKASAFGNTAADSVGPTTGSALYNGTSTVTPFYVVGNNPGVYNYPNVSLSAYFAATSGTATITIDNGNPECHGYNSGGIVGPDYTVNGPLPPAIQVLIPGYGIRNFTNGCANDPAKTFTVDIGSLPNESDFPSQVYKKIALISVSSSATGQGENSFRVITTVGGANCAPGVPCSAVGLSAQVANATGLGFRASPPANPGCTGCTGNIDNGNHWTGEVMFAPSISCSDFNSGGVARKSGTINYYDADPPGIGGPGDQWNPNIQFRLQHQALDASGKATGNWGDIIQPLDTAYLTANPSGTFRGQLSFVSGWRYRILFENVGVRNTIKFSFSGGISQVSSIDPLTIGKCYSAQCSITYSPAVLNAGDTVNISIKMTNTGINDWVAGQQFLKRTGPGPSFPTIALGSNVGVGGTYTFNDSFKIPSSNTYTYRMYVNGGLQMNQSPIPCSKLIQVGCGAACIGPSPAIVVTSCSAGIITNISTANIKATYHPPGPGSPYLTYQQPDNYPATPYVWAIPPPVATPPYIGPTYSYTPPGGPSKPITQVPVQINVLDSGGNLIYTYQVPPGGSPGTGGITKDSGDFSIDMADLWTKANMFPHNDYQLQLVVEGVSAQDSMTYKNDGNWSPDYTPVTFNTQPITGCWEASCSGTFTTATDVEPGETDNNVQVGFTITNRSPRSFNNVGQYNALPSGDNQGTFATSGPVAVNIPKTSSGTVNATFPLVINYRGNYSAVLRFGGTDLTEVCQGPDLTPSTRPFFQVWGGDIFTGGSFNDVNQNCPSTFPDYISPQTAPGNDANYGGIKAYANTSTGHGSATDFGAVALGLIADKPPSIGFLSHYTFANSGSFPGNSSGGYLNSVRQAHCVTDFFDTTQNSPASIGPPNSMLDLTGSSTDQYIVGSQVNAFAGGSVGSGQHITLYVNGDVTIIGNITYGNWNRDDSSSAPYFALIVKGNITLGAGVTRLDGLYVAQPTATGSGTGGDFNTCDNFCNQQLIVNGSVVAQHIQLLRSFGTLSTGSTLPSKPAEIFNYLPSMLIGAPNLNPLYNSTQTLISLPPVF